jgi:hypothetical protein
MPVKPTQNTGKAKEIVGPVEEPVPAPCDADDPREVDPVDAGFLSEEDAASLLKPFDEALEQELWDTQTMEYMAKRVTHLLAERRSLDIAYKAACRRVNSGLNFLIWKYGNQAAAWIRDAPKPNNSNTIHLGNCSVTLTRRSAEPAIEDRAAATAYLVAEGMSNYLTVDWRKLKPYLKATGEMVPGTRLTEASETPTIMVPGFGAISRKTGLPGAVGVKMDLKALKKIGNVIMEESEDEED